MSTLLNLEAMDLHDLLLPVRQQQPLHHPAKPTKPTATPAVATAAAAAAHELMDDAPHCVPDSPGNPASEHLLHALPSHVRFAASPVPSLEGLDDAPLVPRFEHCKGPAAFWAPNATPTATTTAATTTPTPTSTATATPTTTSTQRNKKRKRSAPVRGPSGDAFHGITFTFPVAAAGGPAEAAQAPHTTTAAAATGATAASTAAGSQDTFLQIVSRQYMQQAKSLQDVLPRLQPERVPRQDRQHQVVVGTVYGSGFRHRSAAAASTDPHTAAAAAAAAGSSHLDSDDDMLSGSDSEYHAALLLSASAKHGHAQSPKTLHASGKRPTKRRHITKSPASIPPRPAANRKTKTCACCGVTSTPLWRDYQDVALCNACGIRFKKYKIICRSCQYVPCKQQKDARACCRCDTPFAASH